MIMTTMWEPVSGLAMLVAKLQEATGGANNLPYVVLLAAGFVIGAWGGAAKLRWLVAIGIGLIVLAIALWQFDVFNNSPHYVPPGA
jgi:hypothetical protein